MDELAVLDDLLDDVHEEATRERDAERAAEAVDAAEDAEFGDADELSPDEMLRQLDAVTLSEEDVDDSDPIADFEDAREDLHQDAVADEDDAEAATESKENPVGEIDELAEEIATGGDGGASIVGDPPDASYPSSLTTEAAVDGERGGVADDETKPTIADTHEHEADTELQDVSTLDESSDADCDDSSPSAVSTADEAVPDMVSSRADNDSDAAATSVPNSSPALSHEVGSGKASDFKDESAPSLHREADLVAGVDEGEVIQVEELVGVRSADGDESVEPVDSSDAGERSADIAPSTDAAAIGSTARDAIGVNSSSESSASGHIVTVPDEQDSVRAPHEQPGDAALLSAVNEMSSSESLRDTLSADEAALHANIGETSAEVAGDPEHDAASMGAMGAVDGNAGSDAHEVREIPESPDAASSSVVSQLEEAHDIQENQEAPTASDPDPDVQQTHSDTAGGESQDVSTSQEIPDDARVDEVRESHCSADGTVPDRMADAASASVGVQKSGDANESDVSQQTLPPAEEDDRFQALPPPAPTALAVVVGSMVPASNDDGSDSDSQDEDDGDQSLPPPPLNLDELGDDNDGDELEIDPAVASTIEIEKQQRSAKDDFQPVPAKQDTEPSLLAVLSDIKPAASSDEIEFSFAEEVRVANVVVPPLSDFEATSKPLKQQDVRDDSTENVFGIGYTSLKKKRDGASDSAESEGYSIPTAPAFPDEKEFENELGLSSDLVFSVRSMQDDDSHANENDDDEFGPVTAPNPGEFSTDILDARRASLQAQKVQEEESIINELKRATNEEKSLNESAAATADPAASAATSAASSDAESAISLKELHGIYKRGLGDQGVLLLDEDDEDKEQPSAAQQASAPSDLNRSLSVMGRILSKPSMLSQAITEEDEEDEDNGNDTEDSGAYATHKDRETLIDYAAERDESSNSAAADEWKEIQLTSHSATRASGRAASPSDNTDQQRRDPSDSKPAANFKISYNEAFQYCLQADEFLIQLDKIVAEDFGEAGRSCFSCFSPRPRLAFAGATDERDRVFCIAATSYDPQHDIFARALQTLYTKLTRTQREAPLSGTHWEDIGFQGNDPSTDLRGCGVLSLLQMLYLVDNHLELALRFHSLSQHPTRHFPLACALINVTLQCVLALRSGALYKECNKQGGVFKAINSFYVALATELMNEIHTSADEIPIIIKEVLEEGRNNPDRVIEEFSKQDARATGAQSAASPQKQKQIAGAESSTQIEFTEIALQSAASDE